MCASSWLVETQSNPSACLRLFCFPYAGGGASSYRLWSELLPPWVDVCPIQLPGRENRRKEPPYMSLTALVQDLATSFSSVADPPFAFFGHSLGALIGFELARELRKLHKQGPLHFFASGRKAPQIPREEPGVSHLPDHELIEVLRGFNGTPQAVLGNTELMLLYLPILRADFSLYETYAYRPEAPLDCPITAFGGLDDIKVSRDDLMRWKEQTSSFFRVQMFPGDHFFLLHSTEMLLQALSRELKAFLYSHSVSH